MRSAVETIHVWNDVTDHAARLLCSHVAPKRGEREAFLPGILAETVVPLPCSDCREKARTIVRACRAIVDENAIAERKANALKNEIVREAMIRNAKHARGGQHD